MAAIEVDDDRVHIGFSTLEKVFGLARGVSFPTDAITSVEVVEDGTEGLEGIRAPGLGIPGFRYVGTWRHRGGKDLVSVRRGQPALRIVLRDQRYDAGVIGVDDAHATRDLLEAA